jgi:hypothetical protein
MIQPGKNSSSIAVSCISKLPIQFENLSNRPFSSSCDRWDWRRMGDQVIIYPGAAQERKASSRDPRYLEQLQCVVDGEVEEGPCGIEGYTFPGLALHHKYTTCGKYVHNTVYLTTKATALSPNQFKDIVGSHANQAHSSTHSSNRLVYIRCNTCTS